MEVTGAAALGQAVQRARRELDLSQAELADLAGMSRVSVSRLEAGTANTTLDSLLRVASVLGMRLDATWTPAAANQTRLPRKRARSTSNKTAHVTKNNAGTTGTTSVVHVGKSSGKSATVARSAVTGAKAPRRKASLRLEPVDLNVVLEQASKK